jgi:hypothetical protein
LHHRFRLFPSVNIHCSCSLFKPASLTDGWTVEMKTCN